jgi:basic membrane lipoprotein Med (substrate-binding protein (PBP1-ABC) superfamily)
MVTAFMTVCGAVKAEDKTLIGFAFVGSVADQGYTGSHNQARLFVEEQLGDKVKTVMVDSIPYSDETSRTLEQFVADGAKMIITNSQLGDFISKVSDRYTEVAFLEGNGPQQQTDNKSSFYVNHWDPSYLIGMMAGLLSKTGKLGFVASFPIDSVYSGVNSFILGARSVNPNATCTVVTINSWFDPSKATQAAEALVSDGCDFLFGIMAEASYLQVAEKEGIWAAMWSTDVRRFGPNAYVSSVMLDWKKLYLDEVKKVLDGTWKGNRLVLLPMGEGVDRDSWGKNVPEQLQWMVDAVRDHMIGGWSPFVGPIKDKDGKVKIPAGEKLTEKYMYDSWLWSVEGVSGLPN